MRRRLTSSLHHLASQVSKERLRFRSNHPECLHCNRDKEVVAVQVGVLLPFTMIGLSCDCPCLPCGESLMGAGKSVRTCCIPNQNLPSPPWDHRGPIWPFAIRTVEPDRLKMGWDLGCVKGSLDKVINGCMSRMAVPGLKAAEFISSFPV